MREAELCAVEKRAAAFRKLWSDFERKEPVEAVRVFHLAEIYENDVLRLVARIRELEGK